MNIKDKAIITSHYLSIQWYEINEGEIYKIDDKAHKQTEKLPKSGESWFIKFTEFNQIFSDFNGNNIKTVEVYARSIGSVMWTFFEPYPSSVDAWHDHPEQIKDKAFIKFEVLDNYILNEDNECAHVRVLDVIRLDEITSKFPLKKDSIITDLPLLWRDHDYSFSFQNEWLYYSCHDGPEVEVYEECLIRLVNDKYHLVLYSTVEWEVKFSYLLNSIVPYNTIAKLNSWAGNA